MMKRGTDRMTHSIKIKIKKKLFVLSGGVWTILQGMCLFHFVNFSFLSHVVFSFMNGMKNCNISHFYLCNFN